MNRFRKNVRQKNVKRVFERLPQLGCQDGMAECVYLSLWQTHVTLKMHGANIETMVEQSNTAKKGTLLTIAQPRGFCLVLY